MHYKLILLKFSSNAFCCTCLNFLQFANTKNLLLVYQIIGSILKESLPKIIDNFFVEYIPSVFLS